MIYLIILSILSPKILLFRGITISLLDFLPLIFFIHVILSRRTKIQFTKKIEFVFKLTMLLSFIWLISSIISILFHFEPISSIKSLLQLYRRLVSILIVPLYLLYLKRNYNLNNLIKFTSIAVIFMGIIGELINFSPQIRDLYMAYISNSKQTINGIFFRNMGFIGEPNYFAILIAILILANIFLANYKRKIIYVISLFIIMLSTFSKSVISSFLIVSILMALLEVNKKILLKISIVPIFFLMLIPIIKGTMNSLHFNELMKNYFLREALISLNDRVAHIWIESINIFSSNYLNIFFGLGMKGLKSYYNIEGVHNNFLAFIIDFGLFGGILVLFLLIFFIPYSIKRKNKFLISTNLLLIFVSFVHEPFYHPSILALLFFFYFMILKIHT